MNNQDYRYQLDSPKVTGRRQQKTECPHCHRKRCFVRYVDTRNNCQYVDSSVGRCDHEQSCGYHYKPSAFFQDHPWMQEQGQCANHAERRRIANPDTHDCRVANPAGRNPQPSSLPPEYLLRSMSPQSTFWQWFTDCCARQLGFSQEDADRVHHDYGIGATRDGDVIFWQVDEQGRIRSGHIMHYNMQGHREGYQSWVHDRLIKKGLLDKDYQLVQCFFGQHLLTLRPYDTVCIVESEKTALIMAALQPQHLWLATCGSSGLTAQKCQCLRGRRVVLFPDSGCLVKWQQRMLETTGIDYSFCKHLEQYPHNTDLADLLLTAQPCTSS